ncbi:uncharacterized protein LOC111635448 [Centruroides sculpturatus]|uniref:uncharacterized protein LOC111635448 n=1 Tax=Centruroides sculpturatus TaxID=218467 RepID=UPI000C6E7320|nr:uncharacterized protein LOC111635448 [Centruroides sculpturatus]
MKQETKIEKFSMSGNKSPPQRPKRNIAQKSMDYNNGLLWREEKDLKKALYASLQEGKRRAMDGEVNGEQKDDIKDDGKTRRGLAGGHLNSKNNQEASPKRARVHAQRKFAQGSTPNSPAPTPVKICSGNSIATDLLPCRRPKTEDFLTFLCLRGTSILPPSLDFLNNCAKSDSSSDSREGSPEPELFDMASYKEYASKSEHDKFYKHENISSLRQPTNKYNLNRKRSHSNKEGMESESASEESTYNMQCHQKRSRSKEVYSVETTVLNSLGFSFPLYNFNFTKVMPIKKCGFLHTCILLLISRCIITVVLYKCFFTGTSILPPSLDFLNNCAKSDSSSDSREGSPEPELFDMASYKEYASKSEHDKFYKHENISSLRQPTNKYNLNRKRSHSNKEGMESESASEESTYNMQCHQKRSRSKEVLNNRKRKFLSDDSEFQKHKQTAPPGRLRLLQPNNNINGKSKQLASVSALKEKYKQQRLAKQRTKTFHNQKENLSHNSKPAITLRTQNINQNSNSSVKRTVENLINVRQTRSACSASNKTPVENKRLLRSSKIHQELSLPVTRTATQQNSTTPWLRKAKLVPPILDFDSDSDTDSNSSITIKKVPQKQRTERSRISLRKDSNNSSKQIKNIQVKNKTMSHMSIRKAALLSTAEHSYVKLPPPEKITQSKTQLTKKYKTVVKKKFVQPVRQVHDTLGRTRSSKLCKTQISKPMTRSARLKEMIINEAKLEKKNEKRMDCKVSKSKLEGKVNIDAKKVTRGRNKKILNQEKLNLKELTNEGKLTDQVKQKVSMLKNKEINQIIETNKLRKYDDNSKCLIKEKEKSKSEKQNQEKEKCDKFNNFNKLKQFDSSKEKSMKKDGKSRDLERISSEDHKYTCKNSYGIVGKKEKFNKKDKQNNYPNEDQSQYSKSDKDYQLALRKKKNSGEQYAFNDFEKLMEDEGFISKENLEFNDSANKSKKFNKSGYLYQRELSSKKSSKKVLSKLLNKYSKNKGLQKKTLDQLETDEMSDEYNFKKSDSDNSSETVISDSKDKALNDDSDSSTKELNQSEEAIENSSLNNRCETNSTALTSSVGQPTTECPNDETETSYIIEDMSDGVATFDAISNEMAQTLPSDLVFGSAEEIQSLMTSEFSGVFDEAFTAGAILLTTRDTLAQVPLHFIQELTPTKTMADAATNTCEEDLLACMNEGPLRSEETSVGTQTMTPVGSPLPVTTDAIVPEVSTDSSPKESGKTKVKNMPKAITSPGTTSTSLPRRRSRTTSFSKKLKLDDNSPGKDSTTSIQDNPKILNAPVFYPSQEDFLDPLEYIKKIQPEAEKFGICKIVPPAQFKIGGIELDLSKFYHTVQHFGGLQQVIEKKKWQRVADAMHIPKAAQDRVTKLYDAYCKYLVPYDTLSEDDKKRLEEEVMVSYDKWAQQRLRNRETGNKDDDDDEEEINNDCVTKVSDSKQYLINQIIIPIFVDNHYVTCKGVNNLISSVGHAMRQHIFIVFQQEFWKIVTERARHLVVHAGNIDSSVYGSGFPCNKNSLFSKHPWNLKVLTNNPGSILRCMGPVSGVTIPTLHVGMLFTTGCWYRDPHSLPWIEYLHTGASKIWYSTPEACCNKFREAMKKIMPDCCTSNPIWLPSDTAMVPPDMLVEHGATLSRTVQDSGQFIVIFPGAFTSTICCGYTVSESVYFAPPYWLDMAQNAFRDIRNSCEPPAFSLERLFFCIANDNRTQVETLQKMLPMIEEIRDEELQLRKQLYDLGLKTSERLPLLEVKDKKKRSRGSDEDNEQECEVCRSHCYVSMVVNSQEEAIYCLHHACEHIQKKKNLKYCKLMYTYDQSELNELIQKITDQIQSQKNCIRKKSPKKKPSSP